MLKLENSIRGLSFSRVAFDLKIQDIEKMLHIEQYLTLWYNKQYNKKYGINLL